MNHDKPNITASVLGGVSDKNCGAPKVYTDPLPDFLEILLMMKNGKGKSVPLLDRYFTSTTFKGQKCWAPPWRN